MRTILYFLLLLPALKGDSVFAQGADAAVAADPNAGFSDPLLVRAKQANANFNFHPDRQYGSADVTANIENATLHLGSSLAGSLPVSGLKLPAGRYNYRVTLPNLDPAEGSFTVTPGQNTKVSAYLAPKKGTAVIRTAPPGAQVALGDKPLGSTTDSGLVLGDLDAGTYIVKLTLEGYQPVSRTFQVVPAKRTGLTAYLEKNFGSVKVVSLEDGFFVYINDIYWGRTPIVVNRVRPGKAVVRVEAEKRSPLVKTVFVEPGKTLNFSAVLQKDRSVTDVGPYGKFIGSWGDDDGDALSNKADECPIDPEDIDNYQDADGCPEFDNDFDGVSDVKEQDNKYRDLPEDFDGNKDEDGAPDYDNDGDYVPDTADLCPNTPEDRDGSQDLDGCPDSDDDGDGVMDAKDLAPRDPEDKDGFQDADGAPDLDNDGDGIRDYADGCPTASEVFNNFQDDDGCPDAKISEPKVGPMKEIAYDPSAEFSMGTFAQLDSAYEAMVSYAGMMLDIKVHADGKGSKKRLEEKLGKTQERAALIKRYFDYRALVPGDRYSVQGLGTREPRASNVSEAGRAKNNRIEIRRVK